MEPRPPRTSGADSPAIRRRTFSSPKKRLGSPQVSPRATGNGAGGISSAPAIDIFNIHHGEAALAALTTLYITRHGLSEHNLNTRFYMGRSPASPLVEEGREQARRLGSHLTTLERKVTRIVCSSLPRTVETARIAGAALGIASVSQEDAFWELSKGAWEGSMPRENLPAEVERALEADPFGYRYPEGESYRDVVARAGPAFDRWVERFAGETVLFVLHGDVIRALMYHLLHFPEDKIGDFATLPCSLTEFSFSGSRYTLVRFNDDSHLR